MVMPVNKIEMIWSFFLFLSLQVIHCSLPVELQMKNYIVLNDWRLIYIISCRYICRCEKNLTDKKIELYIWCLKNKNDEFLKPIFCISGHYTIMFFMD